MSGLCDINAGERVIVSILDDYLREVGYAAGQFQYLEECLEMYLAGCFEIVRSSVQDQVQFTYTYKGVANKPFGPLVKIFAKYTSNVELLEILQGLPKRRNYIAHEAYLTTAEQRDDPNRLAKELMKVQEISAIVHDTFTKLVEETKRIDELRIQLENIRNKTTNKSGT